MQTKLAIICCSLFFIISLFFASCRKTSALEQVLIFAGENRSELEKVLQHYQSQGEEQKLKAAEFLISNMDSMAFSLEGDILSHYDIIFHLYDSIRKEGVFVGEPPVIQSTWDSLVAQYGLPELSMLDKKYDCQHLKASFLIENIDAAFEAWQNSPLYRGDFELFRQYILPYRTLHEPVENNRKRYYEELKPLFDTITSPEQLLIANYGEFNANRHYKPSQLLWGYPADIPASKMEIGRRGTCRHMTCYQTLLMRAYGLPVSIDRAIWSNRSQGHSWNVLHVDSGKILPFDPFSWKRLEFSYKPAKVFRTVFDHMTVPVEMPVTNDIPPDLYVENEIDVTAEYGKAFHVEVPILYPFPKKKFGVICTFDNRSWRAVHWGEIKGKTMHFEDMYADVLYLAAYYEKGVIVPASDPFLLLSDGTVRFCTADDNKKQMMNLERKYPRFRRIEGFAWGLIRAKIEGSNHPAFANTDVFHSIGEFPYTITDYSIDSSKPFRYIRLNVANNRAGNLAEIEFYGKKTPSGEEELLQGKIVGCPVEEEGNPHPYRHAMDGNLETWFEKERHTIGWVGLDLGKGNEHIITRVRLCPRSDTNFILPGDTYELFYWDKRMWESMGKQIAENLILTYNEVPSNAVYLLRNLSRGKEERIFTYEGGEQVWW